MNSPGLIRRGLSWASHRAFRSRPLAEALFGIRFLPVDSDHYYFDATLFVLTRHLRKAIRWDHRVLDMGTGTAAAIGLYLWKYVGCHVLSVDINPAMVRMSEASVQWNNAPIRVIESDLFERVDEVFDIVVFNPPYVPTRVGEARGMREAFRSQWDGGPAGLDVIERFLAALAALPHPVEAHIGVNKWHVDDAAMLGCVGRQPGLAMRAVHHHAVLPIAIYVVENRHSRV